MNLLSLIPLRFISAFLDAACGDDRPNVLFIFVDDLDWRDLSIEGGSFYDTLAMDALAARLIRFRQGYAACQVHSPSRATSPFNEPIFSLHPKIP